MANQDVSNQSAPEPALLVRRWTIATESELPTELIPALRAHWGERLPALIALQGPLGAGKTTLVKHLLAALGAPIETVSSPTYGLIHEYPLPEGQLVYHADCYRRLPGYAELQELLATGQTSLLIEWPELLDYDLPWDYWLRIELPGTQRQYLLYHSEV